VLLGLLRGEDRVRSARIGGRSAIRCASESWRGGALTATPSSGVNELSGGELDWTDGCYTRCARLARVGSRVERRRSRGRSASYTASPTGLGQSSGQAFDSGQRSWDALRRFGRARDVRSLTVRQMVGTTHGGRWVGRTSWRRSRAVAWTTSRAPGGESPTSTI